MRGFADEGLTKASQSPGEQIYSCELCVSLSPSTPSNTSQHTLSLALSLFGHNASSQHYYQVL